MAIRDQERAGLDVITDGEQRRESYSNRVVMALDGIDVDNPGRRAGPQRQPVPGAADRRSDRAAARPILIPRRRSSCARTPSALTKVTIPGPFTMAQQAQDDHYGVRRAMSRSRSPTSCAPRSRTCTPPASTSSSSTSRGWSRAPTPRGEYGIETLQRALEGVRGTTALHICFGYPPFVPGHKRRVPLPGRAGRRAGGPDLDRVRPGRSSTSRCSATLTGKTIILGVIALRQRGRRDAPRPVAERAAARAALQRRRPGRRAPDCGMKYLTRESAFGKLQSLVEGAKTVSVELA